VTSRARGDVDCARAVTIEVAGPRFSACVRITIEEWRLGHSFGRPLAGTVCTGGAVMLEPAKIINQEEEALRAEAGRESFAGFAIPGQPFASGDVLCLRRFRTSTIGPGYSAVWHRSPAGEWTVYTSVAAELSCPRFIGAALSRVVETPVELEWTGPAELSVRVPAAGLRWDMRVGSTAITRLMNAMMAVMPRFLYRSNLVLAAMSAMSTAMLAAGRFLMGGHMPNRQWFQVGPRRLWSIPEARASIAGRDFGPVGPLAQQPTIGEVPLPQRGYLMLGGVSFEAFAAGRHLPARRAENGVQTVAVAR
jgi:hypothetical protein